MTCPECGEPAAHREPADLVPWEAHGMTRPQWSHTDGSALCPVPGPSGGYRPAQPAPAHTHNLTPSSAPARKRPGWIPRPACATTGRPLNARPKPTEKGATPQ
jgi:hypothetical protein